MDDELKTRLEQIEKRLIRLELLAKFATPVSFDLLSIRDIMNTINEDLDRTLDGAD